MKCRFRIILLLFLTIITNFLFSQKNGIIVSPCINDRVKNKGLFIVFDINSSINPNTSKIDLFIDDLSFSPLIKIKDHRLTALILQPLKPGKHTIKIRVILDNDEALFQSWDFFVMNENKMKKKFPDLWDKHKPKKDDFRITGSLSAITKFVDLSGDGAELRQEPPQTHQFKLDGGIGFKKYYLPFKFFFTNHERPGIPPRNRLMLSIKGKKAGFVIGDANPKYDRLILNGSRIRGGEAYVRWRNVKFGIAHGEINRKDEGIRKYWNINQGFQPINMQPEDSSYVDPGTYKRNLSAFNLEVTPPNSGNKLRFTLVRSTDVENSIQYGGPAEQNIAGSLNGVFVGRDKKYQIDVGVAVSATTRDIRRGAVSKEDFESTYKRELRVDPELWENIFIINSTTVPLSTTNASFLGLNINSRFNIMKQHISINFQRLGSGFESFGNPYLQNDRYNVFFRDRIPFWQRKINLMFQYRYNEDNLSKIKSVKNITHMAGTNLTLAFGPKIPRIIGGYRIYIREGILVSESSAVQNIQVTNYNAGINYTFKTGNFTHGFNVVFNRNIRENFVPSKSRNDNDVVNFGINESFPYRINLSIQYNHLLLANDTSDLTEQQTLGIRIGYSTKNKKIRVSAGGRQISALESDFLPESIRQVISIDVTYNIIKNASLKLLLGNSTYQEPKTDGRNYNENWGQMSLRYQFN